ncbi:MAG: AAA family ATPase, partial [Rubrivivax sp.]|nr:AAA family ATPase [Rubrivivax sp.]
MTLATVPPADLRLHVDAQALGFADTSALTKEPLPWIGQERAERAGRFGLQMEQPDYNLFVL